MGGVWRKEAARRGAGAGGRRAWCSVRVAAESEGVAGHGAVAHARARVCLAAARLCLHRIQYL